jgi:hypothetical protein
VLEDKVLMKLHGPMRDEKSEQFGILHIEEFLELYEDYPKASALAARSENCKWYSSLPLGAVVSLFCEPV